MKRRTSGARRATPGSTEERSTAWITEGFEQLLYDVRRRGKRTDFDVIVVGSGYGGAVAAAELAGANDGGRPVSVCVLERGKEYLPGMFPARMADLPGHVRYSAANSPRPKGVREGLFDVRIGPDVCALVANGLGGGSLINAGVMEEPDDAVFASGWPEEFQIKARRSALYARAKMLLGAAHAGGDNTVKRHPGGAPKKFSALQRLADDKPFRAAALTIAMTSKTNGAGVMLNECAFCGDCATGCNHGAKDSLDVNLLVKAWRLGAKIYTGATVLRIEREVASDRWTVVVVHTDERLREREPDSLKLTAGKLILAAGTFGSTEILLRSRSDALQFSPCLGQRFSINGDMIAMAYGQRVDVNAVARGSVSAPERRVGPTTTGLVDLRAERRGKYVVQDLAIPAALQRVFEEIATTSHALHQLENADTENHGRESRDPCAVDAAIIDRSSVFAVMGRDGAAGSLELIDGPGDDDGDGALRVRWPQLRDRRLFSAQMEKLRALVRHSGVAGKIIPSPLWQLLPTSMHFLLGSRHGPLVTVHPLGGCPMGRDTVTGVVDSLGRVFDASVPGDKTLRGLVVLDGSIVPTSLGINPALTITALALCATEKLRAQWGWTTRTPSQPHKTSRPTFADPPPPEPSHSTVVEFIERMSGKVWLRAERGPGIACVVELTLQFEKCAIADLVFPSDRDLPPRRTLTVCKGELRLFRESEWSEWREHGEPEQWRRHGTSSMVKLQDIVELRAPVTGTMTFLPREKSTERQRVNRSLRAWFWNRGLRDSWQWLADRWQGRPQERSLRSIRSEKDRNFALRYRQMRSLASRAGEARLIEYNLSIGEPMQLKIPDGDIAEIFRYHAERGIQGVKRITYARRSNPWRQLTQMELRMFPGLVPSESKRLFRPTRKKWPTLDLDAKYWAQRGAPALRIVDQGHEPSALADLMSLTGYVCRVLIGIHAWSFRRPDTPTPREPQRLPVTVPGLPLPVIKELPVDRLPDGTPVAVRLTRYCPGKADGAPVVLIHGYSASGTTFAHHAVKPNLAQHLCARKRDVWVLDLRTSSGMPTARYPWTFEDAALADLPAAFEYIRRATGSKFDVVAHCMGAAMFSMSVLAPAQPGSRFLREREALPTWIHRAVLSQIGPVVVMSPGNIFRAYVMNYLGRYFPTGAYDFRVKPDPGLIDRLIDRLLATLPYPEEDFDVENPPWPPWRRTAFVGTRHRMDALYGRDFNLAGKDGKPLLDPEVLEYIDDLFGAMNIQTVSQAIDLTRMQVIASATGRNEYVSLAKLKERWIFPTLSIHGEDNGLVDVATLTRIQTIMRDQAGCSIQVHRFPGVGHQDSLIGKNASQVFEVISDFLD